MRIKLGVFCEFEIPGVQKELLHRIALSSLVLLSGYTPLPPPYSLSVFFEVLSVAHLFLVIAQKQKNNSIFTQFINFGSPYLRGARINRPQCLLADPDKGRPSKCPYFIFHLLFCSTFFQNSHWCHLKQAFHAFMLIFYHLSPIQTCSGFLKQILLISENLPLHKT